MDQKMIGQFLAECRKEKNLTQEQLAEQLGTTAKSVSRWENGKTLPDYLLLEELTAALGISVNEFFAGKHVAKEEAEHISEENLCRLFRERYGAAVRKKYLWLCGIIGGLLGILIYLLTHLIF